MRPVILVFTIGKCKTMFWCILDLIGREYGKLLSQIELKVPIRRHFPSFCFFLFFFLFTDFQIESNFLERRAKSQVKKQAHRKKNVKHL